MARMLGQLPPPLLPAEAAEIVLRGPGRWRGSGGLVMVYGLGRP
jgi:hypothetical protein